MDTIKQVNEIVGAPLWGVLFPIVVYFFRFLIKKFNSVPKEKESLLLIDGLKPWMLGFGYSFSAIKAYRANNKIDYFSAVIFTAVFIVFLVSLATFVNQHALKVPSGWADLYYDNGGKREMILLSQEKAKNVYGDRKWELDVSECKKNNIELSNEFHISKELIEIICNVIGHKEYSDEISSKIEETKFFKIGLYISCFSLLFIFTYVIIDMWVSLYIRDKILKHHEKEKAKAYEYLT
ncbi:DUF6216 family protein [Dickeya sp. ws52]|uniref:DUF6216 family protein n=1 Tax=Dickeya sp. ws52 TaxID=2576377 RepID=UPI00117CCF48|nr:DUF6216 family protein [Dickeya sp. ws52]TYL43713.1 hypothetical protein FDP13_04970 [Dickeya sp. ws52]